MNGPLFVGMLLAILWPDTPAAKHEYLQMICMALLLGCELKVSHHLSHGDIRATCSNRHSQQDVMCGFRALFSEGNSTIWLQAWIDSHRAAELLCVGYQVLFPVGAVCRCGGDTSSSTAGTSLLKVAFS